MLNEILSCFFGGLFAGLQGFLNALPLYLEISKIKDQIIAYIIGVPVIFISAFLIFRSIIKALSHIKK